MTPIEARSVLNRATAASARLEQIAKYDKPTAAQRADWSDSTSELVRSAEELRSAMPRLTSRIDALAAAAAADNSDEIRAHAANLAKEADLEIRSMSVDAVRGRYAGLFESRPGADMRDTSLASLWDQFRSNGFAAADMQLSPDFMESRALATSADTVATTFADSVTVYQRTATPMLDPNVVTLSTSTSGAGFTVPRLTADVSYGGTVVAEAGTLPELDPTISSVTLNPYKFGAITLWSAELDQDQVIELQPLIARSTGRELGLDIGTLLTTGNGSSKPNGFVTAASAGGTATKTFGGTATTFFDYGDLVDLWGSVAAPYRSTGVWQLSTDAFVKVQRFRDDNGNLALIPGLQGGPPTLLGRPVYENPAMAAVASASKSVAFGDFKGYWVRRVTPVRIELSRDYKFNTDQVALKVIERIDGDLVDTAAVKTLVSANT
jgi:HK97 family phage major capsid protein